MIYVLGSLNNDLVATVDTMPQAGETVTAQDYKTYCGGKGANQACAIGKMGGAVTMIGCVGDDDAGKKQKQNLAYYGVNVDFVEVSKTLPTGSAMILVENAQNRIVVLRGANGGNTTTNIDNALKNATKKDIFVCQLEVPLNIVEYALVKAKKIGMTTILNPAPAVQLTPAIYNSTDIIAPNETETKTLTNVDPIDIVYTALAVKQFYAYGLNKAIITLGARGSAVAEGQTITEIDPLDVEVVDTTGAGDTFIGAVAYQLSIGVNLVDACRFGAVASSITIGRKGATDSIPTLKEINAVIDKHKK